MADLPKNVALVYDRLNKWGGAERVLLALHEIFPAAPLYTSVYSSDGARWAQVFPTIIPSFLQLIPLARTHHELIAWLMPVTFETFNLSNYEAVISITSAEAKGIVTRPGTFHLCYCLTPARYLWSHHDLYYQHIPLFLKPLSLPWFKYMKYWDQIASQRPDAYVAISKVVSHRISNYYHRESQVIYPPVNTDFFSHVSSTPFPDLPQKYFLFVGRIVSYKHPEKLIQVFSQLGENLIMVGKGSINWSRPFMVQSIKSKTGGNIRLIDDVTDDQLAYLYQHCQAFIFFHEEDFGIVPVEAMAAGKPVIALNRGGAAETVIDGVTGILLNEDSPETLASAVRKFDASRFDPKTIQKHSTRFSRQRFEAEFAKVFSDLWKKYKNTLTS